MKNRMIVVVVLATLGLCSHARADDASATAYAKATTAKDMAATAYQKARAAHAAIAAAESRWNVIASGKASKADFAKFEEDFKKARGLIDELKDKDVPKLRADVSALDGRIKEVETKISKIDTCIEADKSAQVDCYKWKTTVATERGKAIDGVINSATTVMTINAIPGPKKVTKGALGTDGKPAPDTISSDTPAGGTTAGKPEDALGRSRIKEANTWSVKDPGGLEIAITEGAIREIHAIKGESISDALRAVENPSYSRGHGPFWYAGWMSGGALAGGLTGLAIGLSRGGNDTIDTTSRPGTLIHKEKGDPYAEMALGAVSGALIGIAVGAIIDAAD